MADEKINKKIDWDAHLGNPHDVARNGATLWTSADIAAVTKKKEFKPVLSSAMDRIANGTAVFSDDFAAAMAEGKKKRLPKNLDDIVVDVGLATPKRPKMANGKENKKTRDFCHLSDDRGSSFDCCSDGETKMARMKLKVDPKTRCWVEDKGDDDGDGKPRAWGFKSADDKDAEETEDKAAEDKKLAEDLTEEKAGDEEVCPFCNRVPCIVVDEVASEEGSDIVDWLNEETQSAGFNIPLRSHRFCLCRMHARHLNFHGRRQELPKCVADWIDKHFRDDGEDRTGFIAN